ncbi:hypothetical protein CR513_41315, partial [Mucuna pruriens]
MEIEELQHSLEAHEMRSFKNKHFRHEPTTKEKAKVPRKGIHPTSIRNTKIKNLVKPVNPLKKGGQTKHRSKDTAPKTAREGANTRECGTRESANARECWAREGAKNKPNNCAHLTQDEGIDLDSKVVMLMVITSNKT